MMEPEPVRSSARLIEPLLLVSVLAVGVYLRFHNLAATPGYYSDEGTLLEIAGHLHQGRWQYLALNQSTLLVARMPLFPLMLAGAVSILGEGILALRTLSAMLGVISILSVYVLAKQMGGRTLAVISAAVLAVHPLAIAYSRLGFSYNLLAVLAVLVGLCALRFLGSGRPRQMLLAGLLIGIGTTSDLLMTVFLIPAAVLAIRRGREPLLALLIGAGIPVAAYTGYMLVTAPEAFLFDLSFTIERLSAIPLVAQFPVAALNYARLLDFDPWFIPAVLGVFAIQPRRNRWFLVLLFLLPLLLITRTVTGLAGFGYYYLIPILPFTAIGIAALILIGTPRIHRTLLTGLDRLLEDIGWQPSRAPSQWLASRGSAVLVALGLFILVISPFLISTMTTVIGINGHLSTPIDFLLVDPDDAHAAAEYVNTRAGPQDLVIASPAVAWLIDSPVADFQLALAAEGKETLHLPTNIPVDRLQYDPTFAQARYVIVDGIWRNWAEPVMPSVAEMLDELGAWQLLFERHSMAVFGNPSATR